MKNLQRLVGVAMTAALVFTAPGIEPYRVFAQSFRAGAAPSAPAVVVPVAAQPGFSAADLTGAPAFSFDSMSLVPGAELSAPIAVAVPRAGIPAAAAPKAAAAEARAATTALAEKVRGAESLEKLGARRDADPAALYAEASWEKAARRTAAQVSPVVVDSAAGWGAKVWKALTGGASPRALSTAVQGDAGESPARQAQKYLLQAYAPGNAIESDALLKAVAKYAVSDGKTGQALAELKERRVVVEVKPGTYILAVPKPAEDPVVQDGNAALKQAVEAFDAKVPNALVRAIAIATQAERYYEKSPVAQAKANRKLAEVIRTNAAIALARVTLKQEIQGASADFTAEAAHAIRYLDGAVFALNRNVRPTERVQDFLVEWLEDRAENGNSSVAEAFSEAHDHFYSQRPVVRASADSASGEERPAEPAKGASEQAGQGGVEPYDTSGLNYLNKYGTDITKLGREGSLDPLVGREKELDQIIETLVRKKKNNPVVIGEGGVGKTQIVDGLAQRIADGKVPAKLQGKVIYRLDVNALVAGTKYRGEFEKRMVGVLEEAKASKGRVIVFIDEIHRIMGLGDAEGATGAQNMIKEALQSGTLNLIGATTLKEYREIEKDGAMKRRLKKILVVPPTRDETVEILKRVAKGFSEHHGVAIPDETIEAAVDLTDRYVKEQFQPDKAIELLDEAAAYVSLRKPQTKTEGGIIVLPTVTVDDVAHKVSQASGIPAERLNESELEKLKNLEARMEGRVVNQKKAIGHIVGALRRHALKYKDGKNDKRPAAVILLLGPTGVGKTELAKAVAEYRLGDEDKLIRLDMGLFQEKTSVNRLTGADPGYVGYGEAGTLLEKVRQQPYSVILIDELEKAHPDVHNALLGIMDSGSAEDSEGKKVSFTDTVIIMTSNIGSGVFRTKKQIGIGFNPQVEPEDDKEAGVMEAAKGVLSPEFLNRPDAVVVTNQLRAEDMGPILEIQLGLLNKSLAAKKMSVTLTPAAKEFLKVRGYDREYGARPLKRAINDELVNRMIAAELDGKIKEGDAVEADLAADGKSLVVRKAKGPGGFGGLKQAAPLALASILAVALPLVAPSVTFAAEASVVPVAATAVAPSFLAMAAPVIASAGLQVTWALAAALGGVSVAVLAAIALSYRPRLAAGAAPMSWKPFVFAALGGAALDLGMKIVATWLTPILVPGTTVPVHELGMAARLMSAGASTILALGVGYAVKRWYSHAAATGNAVLLKASRIQAAVGGALIGSAIGQSIEALVRGGVVDWIPVGGVVTNIADLVVWFGAAYTMMNGLFFAMADRSDRQNKPVTMPTFAVYLPIVGGMAAAFAMGVLVGGTVATTLFIQSLFIGVGIVIADAAVYPLVKAFNAGYRGSNAQEGHRPLRFPWTYRIRVAIAALLATVLGVSATKPALPAHLKAQYLKQLEAARPKLVVLDYDWVIATNNGPRRGGTLASPEMIQAIEDLVRSGVKVAIATDRWFEDPPGTPAEHSPSIATLLLDQLSPEARKNILVATDGGAQIWQYNAKGDRPKSPVLETLPFSGDEERAISQAIQAAATKHGLRLKAALNPGDPKPDAKVTVVSSKAVLTLENEDKRGAIEGIAKVIRKELKKAGIRYPVSVRYPANPANLPWLAIRKADKSASVEGILKVLHDRGEWVENREVLLMGDETARGELDLTMLHAVPQATFISVGKKLDPRYGNAVLWPTFGPDGTLEVLRAIGQTWTEKNPEHVFSYTQLSVYENGKKEFIERYGRRPGSARGDSPREPLPVFVGNRVHQVLHWVHLEAEKRDLSRPAAQQAFLEDTREVWKRLWKASWNSDRVDADADPIDGFHERLKDLASDKDRKKRIDRYEEYGREMVERYVKDNVPFSSSKSIALERFLHFTLEAGARRYKFQTKPDRVALGADGALEIHDYKSGRTPTDKEFRADLQFILYAMAVRSVWPQYERLRVRLIGHYPDTDITWEPTEADFDAARARIGHLCDQILEDLGKPEAAATGPDQTSAVFSDIPAVEANA